MSTPRPRDPWSQSFVDDHMYEPAGFYSDRESSLAQVDNAIDARMTEIYRSLPGERLGFIASLAGTVAATVWLTLLGTMWAIIPGVITLSIAAVWIIAGSSSSTASPEPTPLPHPE